MSTLQTICEEGYGSSGVCPACKIMSRNKACDSMRNQEQLHDRMLKTSAKKLQPAEVGNNVIILISLPDRINSLSPRNIVGCITSKALDDPQKKDLDPDPDPNL